MDRMQPSILDIDKFTVTILYTWRNCKTQTIHKTTVSFNMHTNVDMNFFFLVSLRLYLTGSHHSETITVKNRRNMSLGPLWFYLIRWIKVLQFLQPVQKWNIIQQNGISCHKCQNLKWMTLCRILMLYKQWQTFNHSKTPTFFHRKLTLGDSNHLKWPISFSRLRGD